MRSVKKLCLLLVLLAMTACQAISPSVVPIAVQVQAPEQESTERAALGVHQATLQEENAVTPEVSTEELQQILAEGSAFVFDTRPFNEFAISHIPGALNVAPKPGMSMSEYTSDVAEIGILVDGNPDAALVLYCNGPYCGKSKRVAEDLLAAGYTNVRRYQLGIPTWRALVGLTQIELGGIAYVLEDDQTAVFVDARTRDDFANGTLPGAVNMINEEDVVAAKDDGRLPMEDHNTRIIVFGTDSAQARTVATEIAKNAFHNVSFYDGTFAEIMQSAQPWAEKPGKPR